MNEPQPIKRKRGRPPKMRPGFKRETPAIKEGASWHVGVPEDEQDELRKRHNEAMAEKVLDKPMASLKSLKAAMAGAEEAEVLLKNFPPIEPNAVIQIKVEPNRGVLCQVGMVDGDIVHCYSLRPQGHTEYLDVKMGDFIVVAPVRTGMVAMRFEYKPKETAPNWHEEPNK